MVTKITTVHSTYETDSSRYGGKRVILLQVTEEVERRAYAILGGLDMGEYNNALDEKGRLIITDAKQKVVFDGNSHAKDLVRLLEQHPQPGMKLIGLLVTPEGDPDKTRTGRILITSRIENIQ